jgi:branched-subunit amino acid permease
MNEYLLIMIILLACLFTVIILYISAEFFLSAGKNIKRIADALEKLAKRSEKK